MFKLLVLELKRMKLNLTLENLVSFKLVNPKLNDLPVHAFC